MSELRELLIEDLQDLLHAEMQGSKALPKLARAAHSPQLKQALQKHAEETKNQVERLKQAFELLGARAKAKPCKAMQGLVDESQEKIAEGKEKDPSLADILLVASAQKMEHYEISAYGTLRTIAEQLGEKKVARLLAQTEAEEEKTDKLLTKVTAPILEEASMVGEEEYEEQEA